MFFGCAAAAADILCYMCKQSPASTYRRVRLLTTTSSARKNVLNKSSRRADANFARVGEEEIKVSCRRSTHTICTEIFFRMTKDLLNSKDLSSICHSSSSQILHTRPARQGEMFPEMLLTPLSPVSATPICRCR